MGVLQVLWGTTHQQKHRYFIPVDSVHFPEVVFLVNPREAGLLLNLASTDLER
jgi:hypothetical protein